MSAPTNGGPDWALAFAEFHARHRDVKGKKLVFTAIFNAAMESFIICPEVPLVWRVLAWIWRRSWGNDSDYCVDGIGGNPQGQQACAEYFGVDKRRVNDCVTLLRELNFVVASNGHKLCPVDDPTRITHNEVEPKSPLGAGLFAEYCNEWKVRYPTDFQDLESAEATVNRLKKDRLGGYRQWLRARSNHAQTIKANPQQVSAVDHSINEGSAAAANFPNQTAAAALPPPALDSIPPVEVSIAKELSIDDDAASRLLSNCKAVEGTITRAEIVELALMKLNEVQEQIRKGRISNVTGLLIKHVPKMCSGAKLQEARQSIRQRTEERQAKIAWIRETWHEFDPDERDRALKKYPELQVEIANGKGS